MFFHKPTKHLFYYHHEETYFQKKYPLYKHGITYPGLK